MALIFMPVSICMATYNGERFLRPQIASILQQLATDDELIVVDDASQDGTVAYLEGLDDSRLRLYRNETNLGHVKSFARALGLASNQYILMSDQDDIWVEGRVRDMVNALSAGWALVSTNSAYIDVNGKPITPLQGGLTQGSSNHHLANISRIFSGNAPYYGCAMGLREELRNIILPIPNYVESHDLWIAMAANVARSNLHLEEITLLRRVHGTNASIISRPMFQKLLSRIVFLRSLLQIGLRVMTKGSRPGRSKNGNIQQHKFGAS
jgi:glycosyltransferase involved in cell wall biosynthesis